MAKHEFLWFDLETTGLNEHECTILEWAAVLAADDRDGDMSVIEQHTGVVDPTEKAEWHTLMNGMHPKCRSMHEASGLLLACAREGSSLHASDERLFALLCKFAGNDRPHDVVLAGANPSFDLKFACVHLPRFASCLHYRTFDLRTLEMAERSWGVDAPEVVSSTAHRALADVHEALGRAKAWRAARGLLPRTFVAQK